MRLIRIKKNGDLENIKKTNLDFIINNKHIDKLHIWKVNNNVDYILYGCIDGKAGKENKYELPPPLENSLFFDDMYLLKYCDKNFCDLLLNEYNKFYEDCYGGFEDLCNSNNETEESLSEHTSDRDFIDDDTISDFSSNNDITSSIISTISNNLNKVDEDYDDEEDDLDDDDEISSKNDLISSIEITITDDELSDDNSIDTESEN
tara:strand:- start:207 stop:821 length:615 start_codon:yes stop_codon:yes gene_type:complete